MQKIVNIDLKEKNSFSFTTYQNPRLLASAFLIASLIPAMVGLLKFLMTYAVSPYKQGTKAKTEIGFAQRLTWSALLGAIITAITLANKCSWLIQRACIKERTNIDKESTLKQGEGM